MSQTNEQIMQERIDELEEALWRIVQWGEAYPLDIFPEPDWQRARNLLENGGMTLDRVAAGNRGMGRRNRPAHEQDAISGSRQKSAPIHTGQRKTGDYELEMNECPFTISSPVANAEQRST